MKYPAAIQGLIDQFTKLPTVGPKTAERYVFFLFRQHAEELQKFAQAIAELKEKITVCQTCFTISETNPCQICADDKRQRSAICVVAEPHDMLAIEATKQYAGLYHILGGVINAIEGATAEKLTVAQLRERISKNGVEEIILGLNPDMEGETTALYLAKALKKTFPKIKITRLAKGLSMGADLEYADEITLTNALKYRNVI